MTFDEAIDKIDVNGTLIDTLGVLQALQQEYAPTVEMTVEQKHDLLMMKDNNEHIVDIVGDTNTLQGHEVSLTVVQKFFDDFWEPLTEQQLIQAWLDPETIKVVDNEKD